MPDLPAAFHALERMAALVGADQYAAVRRRDRREPGRQRKEQAEAELAALLARHWRAQRGAVRARLTRWLALAQLDAASDAILADLGDEFWARQNAPLLAELIAWLTRAARDGVALFAELLAFGFDTAPVNVEAAAWARQYGYDLVRGLTETVREALREALETFVTTPGQTLRDIMDALPFDETRAARVAVTETTRAYAQATKIAGERLAEQFPDVRVVKTWFTNNDDLVCPICEPLDGREVDHAEDFAPGIGEPPAHVNCRCWTSTSTKIT